MVVINGYMLLFEYDTKVIIGPFLIGLWTLTTLTQALWILASIKVFRVDELGAITFYELPMIRVRRGPKLVIALLFQVYRFSGSMQNDQFPGEPELIQRTDDSKPLSTIEITRDGRKIQALMVRPIRITTSAPKPELGDQILNTQMVLEVTFWARWIIVDPFLMMVNTGGDIERVRSQMRDTGETLLNDEFTTKTPAELVSNFRSIRDALEEALAKSVKTWGIAVSTAGITSPDLNHALASALRDVATEKAKSEGVKAKAKGDRVKVEQAGYAEGKAIEEILAGKGRGLKRSAALAGEGITPADILAAQVAEATLGEGDIILGMEGIAQALGLGKTIFKKKPEVKVEPQDGENES